MVAAGTGGVGGFLLWADLSPEDLATLEAAPDEAATQQALAGMLEMADIDDPLKKEVMLELHLNSLYFARKHGFSTEKTSTFFSIIKRNHDEMAEAFLPPHKSWEYFKTILLTHSVQRPPHSVGIFTRQEAQLITQYALDTYYRHFKLFRYAFTMRHVKEIDLRTSWLELPCDSFPALADGTPMELVEAPAPEPAAPPPAVEMPPIELDANVPAEVKKAVEQQIGAQVTAMREMLERQYAERMARHEAKIQELEGKVK